MKREGAYEILEETDARSEKFWIGLLNTHRCKILNETTFQPIFNYVTAKNEPMTIDKIFRELFNYRRKSLSDVVVELSQSEHFLLYPNFKVIPPKPEKAAGR